MVDIRCVAVSVSPCPLQKPSSSQEEGEVVPQMRGRSASTGSISSTGPSLPTPKDSAGGDSSTRALLLSGVQLRHHSPLQPARKAPLPSSASPKPSRPPPRSRRAEQESQERLPEGPRCVPHTFIYWCGGEGGQCSVCGVECHCTLYSVQQVSLGANIIFH